MGIHGKGLYFAVDDTSDSLQDLSNFTRTVEGLPTTEASTGDTTAAGTDDMTFVRGQRNTTFTVTGVFDQTATTGPDDVLFALSKSESATDVEYSPGGNESGDVLYECSALCTSYVTSAPYNDIVTFTAEFQVTGEVTRSVVA